ncbi:MAG: hypothetical protein M9913_08860 [Bryobacteraceae bacterium]|nr:hypothetical protein [Solibacteraceae bacterium]MCL4842829.1 hypothetical protein [Bryobacteraceae bacterium]MCO5350995.1 hypothetical protein [Bryobacteraceae bacterium]
MEDDAVSNVSAVSGDGVGQGATLVSTFRGVLVWKEIAGATAAVRIGMALRLVPLIGGLTPVLLAPLNQ